MKVIASFKSKKQMISFDMQLSKKGINTRVIPTPSVIALGCGTSIEIDDRDLGAAKDVINAGKFTAFEGFYGIFEQNGRRKIKKM